MAPLTADQLLQSIWAALRRIEDNLALPPAPLEPPHVTVLPPQIDLTDVVEAVNQLKPGVNAEDIARALAEVLSPQPVPAELPGITEFNAAVKELSFRLKGVGAQAYGGGSVSLQPNQSISVANQLIPSAYDEIDMTYTGTDVTGVLYKSAGVTVATLTLTYTGGNLTRVVRT